MIQFMQDLFTVMFAKSLVAVRDINASGLVCGFVISVTPGADSTEPSGEFELLLRNGTILVIRTPDVLWFCEVSDD